MTLIDCHTHTNNSPDGSCSVIQMCERASGLGFCAYAVTDHCEANSYYEERYDVTSKRSYEEITKAKELYPKLNLICGIELGQANQNHENAENAISDKRLDFVIGSVHNLTDFADFAFLDYPHENKAHLLEAYYKEMQEICDWGKFDILGHLTYPLRYIVGEQGFEIDMNPYTEQIREIFKTVIRKGMGIEINTSGLRQKYGKTFPDIEYVKMYRELGGEIISIGSDAHNTKDIGKGIREGHEMALQAGFTNVCYFKNRKPNFISIK